MARVAVREKKRDYPALRRGVVRCMIDRTCRSSSRARAMYGKRRLRIEARDTLRRVRRTPRRPVVGRHARGCRAPSRWRQLARSAGLPGLGEILVTGVDEHRLVQPEVGDGYGAAV